MDNFILTNLNTELPGPRCRRLSYIENFVGLERELPFGMGLDEIDTPGKDFGITSLIIHIAGLEIMLLRPD